MYFLTRYPDHPCGFSPVLINIAAYHANLDNYSSENGYCSHLGLCFGKAAWFLQSPISIFMNTMQSSNAILKSFA